MGGGTDNSERRGTSKPLTVRRLSPLKSLLGSDTSVCDAVFTELSAVISHASQPLHLPRVWEGGGGGRGGVVESAFPNSWANSP